jgi:hypothetical protein
MAQPVERTSPHVVKDQSAILALLADPATHRLSRAATRDIRRIDTHGAVVFLVGPDAYKMKRAVRFPFMDLSTLEKRRAACEAEIAVNRPNAPDIYLGVVPVTREPGGLALGGAGEAVEWLVHMRRFDEGATLDRIADAGGLTPRLLADLATVIRESHARAPLRRDADTAASLGCYLAQNEEAFLSTPAIFPAREVVALAERSRTALETCRGLLTSRAAAGLVRRCHGDLHLRNIALLEGRPVLFDGIEFDEDIATCDVLYDLAFLLMDLWERGLRQEANTILNRWLWLSEEDEIAGLRALPLFLSIRAALRAKIAAAEIEFGDGAHAAAHVGEARRYFAFARDVLNTSPPRLVAVGGLSGTGKSTLAAGLAPLFGNPPGAVHVRSDIERKILAGRPEAERLPAGSYTQAASDEVYDQMLRKAAGALDAGSSVVVDAVFARPRERGAVEALAREHGADFIGLWLEAPLHSLEQRVMLRENDASDADLSVVRKQSGYDVGAIVWTTIDASAAPEAVLRSALERCQPPPPLPSPAGGATRRG